jgi:hypothetical protein
MKPRVFSWICHTKTRYNRRSPRLCWPIDETRRVLNNLNQSWSCHRAPDLPYEIASAASRQRAPPDQRIPPKRSTCRCTAPLAAHPCDAVNTGRSHRRADPRVDAAQQAAAHLNASLGPNGPYQALNIVLPPAVIPLASEHTRKCSDRTCHAPPPPCLHIIEGVRSGTSRTTISAPRSWIERVLPLPRCKGFPRKSPPAASGVGCRGRGLSTIHETL